MSKQRLLFLLILLVGVCVTLVVAQRQICATDVITSSITYQAISLVSDEDSMDIENLVEAADEIVRHNENAFTKTHVGFVLANFVCEELDCQIDRLNVEILATKPFVCNIPEIIDGRGTILLTQFAFDLTHQTVSVERYSSLSVELDPIDWYELPINIDKAKDIAFASIRHQFMAEHFTYTFLLARHFDYWNASFVNRLQAVADIRVMIDNRTGQVISVSS